MKQIFSRLFYFLACLAFSEAFEGFTLISDKAYPPHHSILINNDYQIINEWELPCAPYSTTYLMPDSSLILPCYGSILRFDWHNNLIWSYSLNDDYQNHHDIEPLINGNILVHVWEFKTAEEAFEYGRQEMENDFDEFWPPAILELEPIGWDSANIVWEWHMWDHLIQDRDSLLPNYGVLSDNPQLMDINLGIQNCIGCGDWLHINSIHYNYVWNQIILSSRKLNEFFVIDHTTTVEEAANHAGGFYGKGGDILYRWGNPQNYNMGNISNQILQSQHSVNWIPPGYPGSGNIILFNNNHTNNNSSVLEIIPPYDEYGNFISIPGQAYAPNNYHWMYLLDYASNSQSGAFKLPNGNVIYTTYNNNTTTEITNYGDIVWEYDYDEYFGGGAANQVARVMKYPIDYLAGRYPLDDLNLVGDVNFNGIVDYMDGRIILRYLLGFEDFNFQQKINADISLNNFISAYDASLVLQYSEGLIDSLFIDSSVVSCDVIMPNSTFTPGQLVQVPIYLIDVENVLSFEIKIEYDHELITFVDDDWGESTIGFQIESNYNIGVLSYSAANINSYDEAAALFLTLNFLANENFEEQETVVAMTSLRWNEEPLVTNLSSSILSSDLKISEEHNLSKPVLTKVYPNPFNSKISIMYDISESGFVDMVIFDVMGNRIKTLIKNEYQVGLQSFNWDGTNTNGYLVSTGIYYVMIKIDNVMISRKKLVYLK